MIQIVNSSFLRRTKFVLSTTENKYSKKTYADERAFLNQYPGRDYKRKSQTFYNFALLWFSKTVFKKNKSKNLHQNKKLAQGKTPHASLFSSKF